MLRVGIAIASVLAVARSHTLATCTDLSEDLQTCFGWSRHAATYKKSGDGHISPPPLNANPPQEPCSKSFWGGEEYTTAYPMATATAGDTITIGWPANNHQSANPATGVPASAGPDGKPNTGKEEVDIFEASTKMPPTSILDGTPMTTLEYSNCYQNYNKEFTNGGGSMLQNYLCTGKVTMPSTPGVHTFVWAWKLFEGREYVTCFDVDVKAGSVTKGASNGDGDSGSGDITVKRVITLTAKRSTASLEGPQLTGWLEALALALDVDVTVFVDIEIATDATDGSIVDIKLTVKDASVVTKLEKLVNEDSAKLNGLDIVSAGDDTAAAPSALAPAAATMLAVFLALVR